MRTSDKEIDDLFSSKLNNLEIEPDAEVWGNITAQLDSKPKKKSIIPVLRIAASVLVILSVGLLLIRNDGKSVRNQHPKKILKLNKKEEHADQKPTEIVVVQKDMQSLSTKNKVVKEALPEKRNSKVSLLKASKQITEDADESSNQTIAQNKPEEVNQQQLELPNNQKVMARIAVVPDASVRLKLQQEVETLATPTVKPAVLSVANHQSKKAKRKGIRNMGDLVNLVMAKVDKRDDKLIEFSDSDDGEESNVTGINLGFVSFKKEK